MQKYKVIISDWFEVVSAGIRNGYPMSDLVEKHLGISRELYGRKDEGENWELHKRINRGELTEQTYWQTIIDAERWPTTPEQLSALTDEVVRYPVPGTAEIYRNLHAQGYTMILVSDLWQELKERVLLSYPWINQVFSRCYYSCDYQRVKSDPGFFEFIIKDAGIDSAEAIFIDDYIVNIQRAAEAGLRGIKFEDAIQLKRDLKKLGIYA